MPTIKRYYRRRGNDATLISDVASEVLKKAANTPIHRRTAGEQEALTEAWTNVRSSDLSFRQRIAALWQWLALA